MAQSKRTKKPLGFLDLPPEIRIRVYEPLLINRIGLHGYIPAEKTWVDPTFLQQSKIIIKGSRSGNGSSSLTLPILYGDNDFHFRCSGFDEDNRPLKPEMLSCCYDIFSFNRDGEDVPARASTMLNFDFAALLNMIGLDNAASIKSLSFYGSTADEMAEYLPTITALMAEHLPKLHYLKIHVAEATVFYNESPEYFHPDRLSPFWHNGAFWPLYREMETCVKTVHWLKKFVYSGQEGFAEENSYILIHNLTELVRKRAEAMLGWR